MSLILVTLTSRWNLEFAQNCNGSLDFRDRFPWREHQIWRLDSKASYLYQVLSPLQTPSSQGLPPNHQEFLKKGSSRKKETSKKDSECPICHGKDVFSPISDCTTEYKQTSQGHFQMISNNYQSGVRVTVSGSEHLRVQISILLWRYKQWD